MITTNKTNSNTSVTTINNTNNNTSADVIGNKNDEVIAGQDLGTASIAGSLHTLHEHNHSISYVYPELANPVQITKASGAWAAYPTPTEVIPANTITDTFDLHFALIDTISATGNYTVRLYQGSVGSETLIAVFGLSRTAVQSQEGSVPLITPLIAANTRISAALSSGNAAQNTINLKLKYHTY